MEPISIEDNQELRRLVEKFNENTITPEEKLALLKIIHLSINDLHGLVEEVKTVFPGN